MGDRVKGKGDEIMDAFGARVVKLARINLGRTFTAKRSNGKSFRKRIDSSGTLRKSLGYEVKTRAEDGRFISGRLEFEMAEYGKWVDQGRKRGKGIPSKPLEKWFKDKPIRFKDLKTGKYVEKTEARINSLAFLISRNAKRKGIKPTNFISDPFNEELPVFAQQLAEALGDDYMNGIANRIGNDSR